MVREDCSGPDTACACKSPSVETASVPSALEYSPTSGKQCSVLPSFYNKNDINKLVRSQWGVTKMVKGLKSVTCGETEVGQPEEGAWRMLNHICPLLREVLGKMDPDYFQPFSRAQGNDKSQRTQVAAREIPVRRKEKKKITIRAEDGEMSIL